MDNIFIEEKCLPRLTFNPELALIGFRTTRPWGPFLESPERFGPVKPFLDHLYLKTEKCIRLKLLV